MNVLTYLSEQRALLIASPYKESLKYVVIGLLLFALGCNDRISSLDVEQASSIEVEPSSVTLVRGDTVHMQATPRDAEGNSISGYEIAWASDDTTVASVDADGIVAGQDSGSAVITASGQREGADPISGTSDVTVVESDDDLPPGALEVSTSTSGEELDPDGYTVSVDEDTEEPIDINDTITFSELSADDYDVELSDIASNCSIEGDNLRTISVTAGDTTGTTFEVSCEASSDPSREAVLWEFEEWSLENTSYNGNPFDLVATVTFQHEGSSETRETEMFYDGDDTWKFRFTGTRTGTWTYTTLSDDSDLDGHSGTVYVSDNPDPDVRGFVTTQGNKFARQRDEDELEPLILSIFQDHNYDVFQTFGYGPDWFDEDALFYGDEPHIQAQMEKAFDHGANAVFLREITNEWFELGAFRHDQHDSENPDLQTFQALETAITTVHGMGGILHLWAWGDESRKWTPVGLPGGINGEVDRRLQRYIAARLGPLPGWTMGYGFDLKEWVSDSQVDSWAEHLHDKMGWDHLLWGRDRDGVNIDVKSVGGTGPSSYSEALSKVTRDKPYLEEERFRYLRDFKGTVYDMDLTMDLMWWLAMAEGSAGFWGTENGEPEYSNPEWMRTHARFWENYFSLDFGVDNEITDGYAMTNDDRTKYVFYKEETSSIDVDLSDMAGSQPAVAVDTRASYQEIDLGTLDPEHQTIFLPHSSDWAIAVGDF